MIVGTNNNLRSLGYNGIPRNCDDDAEHRHKRPEKYFYFEHGERNAIYNAARDGVALEGSKIYVGAPPCVDCSRAIIQAGLVELICDSLFVPERWRAECDAGIEMMKEAGLLIRQPNSNNLIISWNYVVGDDENYPGWGDDKSRGLSST